MTRWLWPPICMVLLSLMLVYAVSCESDSGVADDEQETATPVDAGVDADEGIATSPK